MMPEDAARREAGGAGLLPPSLTLREVRFDPPLFCAPMAGLTHSAFRRLIGELGGCGAVYTEMLAAGMIFQERPNRSPWIKRRPGDGKVIYQLLAGRDDKLPEIIERLSVLEPDGLDLNGACPAPQIRRKRGGVALFENADRLRRVVRTLRAHFAGPLTVKIRLGAESPDWRARLGERVRLLRDEGVDALTVHPRFAEEKFRRRARGELWSELAAESGLPIIASGDILGPDDVRRNPERYAEVAGLMIGRMAAVRPWTFAQWHHPGLVVDHGAIWMRFHELVREDFPERQALARLKFFTRYFARNFQFGHTLFSAAQSAADTGTLRERASAFFESAPALRQWPSLDGL